MIFIWVTYYLCYNEIKLNSARIKKTKLQWGVKEPRSNELQEYDLKILRLPLILKVVLMITIVNIHNVNCQ